MKGSSPPLQRPIASPDCYLGLWPIGYKSRAPHDPSLGSNGARVAQNSRKAFYFLFTSLKGTDEHSDGMFIEQVMWKGCRRLPYLLWAPHSPGTSVCSPQKLSNPLYIWDFYGSLISHRHGWLLTLFWSLFPLWRMGARAENSKLLNISWSFWWPAPIQKPTKNHLIWKDVPLTQEIPV